MNKYLSKYLCFFIPFLFGCSASLDKRVDRVEGVDNKLLEKRIDNLSGIITLMVNDSNRLHNKVEEIEIAGKTIQQKMDGLEVTLRDLNERIVGLHTSANTPGMAPPPAEEIAVTPQLSITNRNTPPETLGSDIQKAENTKDLLTVARGFWDAMNAKDMQAVKSYATKESGVNLQIKENATATCAVTFGEMKADNNKTVIDTLMKVNDGSTASEVRMQTVLVKENEQWKVDADQTIMSMFGGAMGDMMKGLGKAMEEGFKKGMAEIGTSMAEGMQKGLEEATQTSEEKPDISPQKQETTASTGAGEQTKRELFLKENFARLAETEFPGNTGILWNILSFEHKAKLTYIEAEPTSVNLGYPRFKFVVSFKNPEDPHIMGTFCFKDGQYSFYNAK